tara:strand:- start:585 stop:851 length:267 start_codon:yes stop_codon:yes gene_type:complete
MSAGDSYEVFLLRLVSALAFSILGASVLGVLSLAAYPNPFFFGFFLGVAALGLTRERQDREEAALITGEDSEQATVLAPRGIREARSL